MRCHGCDRRWPASARFCGRCGARLHGARPRDGTPASATRGDRDGRVVRALAGRWTGRLGAVLLIALTGVVATWLVVAELPTGTGSSGGAVSIPSAAPSPGTAAVRAADRELGPADCGEHLQDLPRQIRKGGLWTGTLEWRDGRLCRPLPPTRPEPPPRCQPPGLPPCTVP